ncbi:hypothetical protein FA15DRAFT_674738, partial [Coprinopsis marcescibilis]
TGLKCQIEHTAPSRRIHAVHSHVSSDAYPLSQTIRPLEANTEPESTQSHRMICSWSARSWPWCCRL